jgi:hypothetical protein
MKHLLSTLVAMSCPEGIAMPQTQGNLRNFFLFTEHAQPNKHQPWCGRLNIFLFTEHYAQGSNNLLYFLNIVL